MYMDDKQAFHSGSMGRTRTLTGSAADRCTLLRFKSCGLVVSMSPCFAKPKNYSRKEE